MDVIDLIDDAADSDGPGLPNGTAAGAAAAEAAVAAAVVLDVEDNDGDDALADGDGFDFDRSLSGGGGGGGGKCDGDGAFTELERKLRRKVAIGQEVHALTRRIVELQNRVFHLKAERHELDTEITSLRVDHSMQTSRSAAGSRRWQREFPWSVQIRRVCRDTFGIRELRDLQEPVMNATLSGQDVFAIMATGSGKSLCYQAPALISDGVTVVVSPLLSLSLDQVLQMRALGIVADMLGSHTAAPQQRDIWKRLKAFATTPAAERIRLLYVTPEKLTKSKTLLGVLEKLYHSGNVARFVVDECHCCSQWGHDFRPSFAQLSLLRVQFPKSPILCCTATATTDVQNDVIRILGLEKFSIFRGDFNRPNIFYEVERKGEGRSLGEAAARIAKYVRVQNSTFASTSPSTSSSSSSAAPVPGGGRRLPPGIVYCLSRNDSEKLARLLWSDHGVAARPYHAGMEPDSLTRVHETWLAGRVQVIVATEAFGMGINNTSVRFVVHQTICKSMISYCQQSGRAGRDGKPCNCLVLYSPYDIARLSPMVYNDADRAGTQRLYAVVRFCQQRDECRRVSIAESLGEVFSARACNATCDNCRRRAAKGGEDTPGDKASAAAPAVNAILEQVTVDFVASLRGQGEEDLRTFNKAADHLFKLCNARRRQVAKASRKRGAAATLPTATKSQVADQLARLLTEGFVRETFRHTAYTTTAYLRGSGRAYVARTVTTVVGASGEAEGAPRMKKPGVRVRGRADQSKGRSVASTGAAGGGGRGGGGTRSSRGASTHAAVSVDARDSDDFFEAADDDDGDADDFQ